MKQTVITKTLFVVSDPAEFTELTRQMDPELRQAVMETVQLCNVQVAITEEVLTRVAIPDDLLTYTVNHMNRQLGEEVTKFAITQQEERDLP